MTGPYEEPETNRELSGPVPPGAGADGVTSDQGSQSAPEHAAPDYGDYAEPATTPGRPYPVQEHPTPSYVDPSWSGSQGGYPYAGNPYYPGAPAYGEPGAAQYADPQTSGPQSGAPRSAQNPTSGPYPVAGGPSGPQPAPGTPPSGAQPPYPGAQSEPYSVSGAPSGPHPPVAGGPSGPSPIPPDQSGTHPPRGQQAYPPQQGPAEPFAQDLSSAQLLRQSKRAPQSGWRRAVYVASGRSINLGESRADQQRRELIARVNQPLYGCYKIAMLSLKGGVGKTTTTATLGSTFSSLRGDRVIAVDANPDRGTLSQKIPLETTATVRHLLRDAQRISKYSDVRAYTSQGPSRLEILASEQDPAVSEAFSEDDYRRTITLLEHFYNVVLTDCGTGLMHSAMKGVLDVADSLVVISSSSIDGARSASATLDWLDAHGYGELVARSVAVINSVRPGSGKVDVDKLAAHFGSRCRSVAKIPFDPHLEEGAEVELDQLAGPTRMALLQLAATVADDFPQARGRQRPM